MDATQNNGRVLAAGNLNGGILGKGIGLLLTPTGPSLAAVVLAFWRWFQIDPTCGGRELETVALALVVMAGLVSSVATVVVGTMREKWAREDARPQARFARGAGVPPEGE